MKFSAALLAAFVAGVVNAQFGMPKCAAGCIQQVIGKIAQTGCSSSDFACICGNDTFIATVGTCVRDACSPEDFQATIDAAVTLCKINGVDVNTTLPPSTPTGSTPPITETGSMTAQPEATGNATTTIGGGGSGGNGTSTGAPLPTETGDDEEGAATGLTAVGFGAVAGLVAAALAL